MFWAREIKLDAAIEEETLDPSSVKCYTIKPGSPLDIPKTIQLQPRDFEESMHEYFRKQVCEEQLLAEMYRIYKPYNEDGGVVIQSTHGKTLKTRHEHVVMELVRENITHLRQLDCYVKKLF